MRIVAVRPRPVCVVLFIVYAVFGLCAFLVFDFDNASELILPFGILMPLADFTFNIRLARSIVSAEPVPYAIAAIAAYAVSGFVTAAALTYCFNFVAGLTGGIDARFVATSDEKEPSS
jgi:hypothetical protein